MKTNKTPFFLMIVLALGFSGLAGAAETSVAQVGTQETLNGGANPSRPAPQQPLGQQEKIDDMKISRSIHDMIERDRSLSDTSKTISVMSDGGVVFLRGRVPSTAERSRLEELAKRAPGVRAVQNMTEISGERSY